MTTQETTSDGAPIAAPEAQFQLRFERFSLFVEEFASRISLGGMFLKSREPRPVSTVISFDIKLADGFRLIQGTGEVVWMRPDGHGPDYPAGMGVRFHSLDDKGRGLVLKLLEEHLKTGGEPFDIDERPLGAIDDAEEAQAAVAAAFPPLPGAEGEQGGLDFDAPWGEKLPELPQEILDEEPTVLGRVALPFPPAPDSDETPGLGALSETPAEPSEVGLEDPTVLGLSALASTPDRVASDPVDELPTMALPASLEASAPEESPPQGFALAEEAVEELESLPDFDLADDSDLEASRVSLPGAAAELPSFEMRSEEGPRGGLEVSELSAFETAEAADLGPAVDSAALSAEARQIHGFDPDQPTVELPPTHFDPGVIPPSGELPESVGGELSSFDPGTPEDSAPSFSSPSEPEGTGEASWPDLPPLGAPESFAPEVEPPLLSDPADLPDPVISDPPAFPPSAAPAFSTAATAEAAEVEVAAAVPESEAGVDASSSLYPVQDYEDDLDGAPPEAPTWKNALVRSAKPLVALLALALLVGVAFWFRGPIADLLGFGEQTSDPVSELAAAPDDPAVGDTQSIGGPAPEAPGTESSGLAPFGSAPSDLESHDEPEGTGLESLEPLASDPMAPEVIAVSAPDSSSPSEPSDLSTEPSSPGLPPATAPPARSEPESRSRRRVATSVVGIEARQEPSGTRIFVSLDGEVSRSRLTIDALDYAPDRQQLRILGIEAPYFPAEIEVGSTELQRIRTGLHEGSGTPELRLVFDCRGPGCTLADLRESGERVELLVRIP